MIIRVCAFLSNWVPQKIITCSIQAIDVHSQIGYKKSKIHMIPNGFDLGKFVPNKLFYRSVRKELGIHPQSLIVGLIARYHPQKNHEGFIKAAAKVANKDKNVFFILCGKDITPENLVLKKLIENTGLIERFFLLGDRKDIPRLMASLDVSVLSSWGEGFSNVLGEAMSCGVPSVVTDVGDCRTILGDGGFVVKKGDIEDLTEKILKLLSDQELRSICGKNSRTRINDNFDINMIVKKYENFYLKELNRLS